MRHKKTALSLTINAIFLAALIGITIVFLRMNTLAGYLMSAVFFAFGCYCAYYFYRILWLHNGGRPLSAQKTQKREQYRKQMRNYQRYNL